MNLLLSASFLALAANRIIEAVVVPLKKQYPQLDLWWLVYVAWVVGGLLSFRVGLNLFVDVLPTLPPLDGQLLTALVVGGGANLIADLFPTAPKSIPPAP